MTKGGKPPQFLERAPAEARDEEGNSTGAMAFRRGKQSHHVVAGQGLPFSAPSNTGEGQKSDLQKQT